MIGKDDQRQRNIKFQDRQRNREAGWLDQCWWPEFCSSFQDCQIWTDQVSCYRLELARLLLLCANRYVSALRDSIEIYAWAPKPYHKFMAFKSFSGKSNFVSFYYPSSYERFSSELQHKPLLVDLTVEEGTRLKVLYGSSNGFHAVDLDSARYISSCPFGRWSSNDEFA